MTIWKIIEDEIFLKEINITLNQKLEPKNDKVILQSLSEKKHIFILLHIKDILIFTLFTSNQQFTLCADKERKKNELLEEKKIAKKINVFLEIFKERKFVLIP